MFVKPLTITKERITPIPAISGSGDNVSVVQFGEFPPEHMPAILVSVYLLASLDREACEERCNIKTL